MSDAPAAIEDGEFWRDPRWWKRTGHASAAIYAATGVSFVSTIARRTTLATRLISG